MRWERKSSLQTVSRVHLKKRLIGAWNETPQTLTLFNGAIKQTILFSNIPSWKSPRNKFSSVHVHAHSLLRVLGTVFFSHASTKGGTFEARMHHWTRQRYISSPVLSSYFYEALANMSAWIRIVCVLLIERTRTQCCSILSFYGKTIGIHVWD